MEWLKGKKSLKIVLIVSIFIVILVMGILISSNIKNKKIANGIEFEFSSDYEYFDISVNDFYKKISYELKDNNIKTKELKSINYDDEYDLFYTPYCEWNYAIDLNNGDRILLCSDNKGKTISSIGYDFTKNIEDGEDVGFFIGRVSKLFHSSDFDSDEFNKKIGDDFLAKDETYDFSLNSNARYAYNHILYGIDTMEGADADGNIDEDSKFIFAIMSPITETTNKEWKENTEKQLEEWKKEYEQQQAEEKVAEEDTKNNSLSSDNKSYNYGYEKIYNDYSEKLKRECPTLSMKECAEISNEGLSKMAEYMQSTSGIDGQYATYEKWGEKLIDVYTEEAR